MEAVATPSIPLILLISVFLAAIINFCVRGKFRKKEERREKKEYCHIEDTENPNVVRLHEFLVNFIRNCSFSIIGDGDLSMRFVAGDMYRC
ncbi:hypothetical protein L1987_17645 [Smallanthus sonchifolius]|uniref:Uncharacterized protein n=1 Tax=Smallanthus sonchifolius TaxID=185202 RepID=A0ACB9IXV9_9ASTR|nr:hypothetical protein L1987_17645 [Smallanthus sonchifolius]